MAAMRAEVLVRSRQHLASERIQEQQRYWLAGLLIAITIHLAMICVSYLFGRETMPPPIIVDWGFGPGPKPPTPVPRDPVLVGPKAGIEFSGELKHRIPVPVALAEDQRIETAPDGGAGPESQWDQPGDGSAGGATGGEVSGNYNVEPTPVDFWRVEKPPVLLKSVQPRYPGLAIRAGLEGRVSVKIWVDRQGKAREVSVETTTNEIFNEAALEASRQMVFVPGYMNSGPVSVWVTVPFTFRLK